MLIQKLLKSKPFHGAFLPNCDVYELFCIANTEHFLLLIVSLNLLCTYCFVLLVGTYIVVSPFTHTGLSVQWSFSLFSKTPKMTGLWFWMLTLILIWCKKAMNKPFMVQRSFTELYESTNFGNVKIFLVFPYNSVEEH